MSRALADLNRYGSNRVGFVKQFLGGQPEIVVPAPQGLSTKEVSLALTRYQKQMAWTDYGFMGHADIKTPHLDELAARSLIFERGYVAAPLCRPSLATLRTSRANGGRGHLKMADLPMA